MDFFSNIGIFLISTHLLIAFLMYSLSIMAAIVFMVIVIIIAIYRRRQQAREQQHQQLRNNNFVIHMSDITVEEEWERKREKKKGYSEMGWDVMRLFLILRFFYILNICPLFLSLFFLNQSSKQSYKQTGYLQTALSSFHDKSSKIQSITRHCGSAQPEFRTCILKYFFVFHALDFLSL